MVIPQQWKSKATDAPLHEVKDETSGKMNNISGTRREIVCPTCKTWNNVRANVLCTPEGFDQLKYKGCKGYKQEMQMRYSMASL